MRDRAGKTDGLENRGEGRPGNYPLFRGCRVSHMIYSEWDRRTVPSRSISCAEPERQSMQSAHRGSEQQLTSQLETIIIFVDWSARSCSPAPLLPRLPSRLPSPSSRLHLLAPSTECGIMSAPRFCQKVVVSAGQKLQEELQKNKHRTSWRLLGHTTAAVQPGTAENKARGTSKK